MDDCYNDNICCPQWSLLGECHKTEKWMACNCRVSCGYCMPGNYSYGTCSDYHADCHGWAVLGECEKRSWMLENCRHSCRSCYSQEDLREMCSGPVGRESYLRTPLRKQAFHRLAGHTMLSRHLSPWGQVEGDYSDRLSHGGSMGWSNRGGAHGPPEVPIVSPTSFQSPTLIVPLGWAWIRRLRRKK
ncbi:hypothetical protein KIN20_022891 [Parelaphostrongylus tenuis]|uniref:ShKT domain-containing protein n=1 Tax=Parelaphostrongylus tenuis TaxID=148309 RepID=A0AAD5NBV5_PARTN|nr:hypothetical protein KIN20_022891 [Parelaphostrongylus tenuis]